jgi:hypothetical protein
MLADSKGDTALGRLDAEIHLPSTAKYAILQFIAEELSNWRDDPSRPAHEAEDRLTESLADHLTSAAYHSAQMNHVKFRTEAGDEVNAKGTMDLSVKPLAATLVIEGRRTTIFETILPIECKRLPTPRGTDRDFREYVFSEKKASGGIQRFKEGKHAAAHKLAGMIGYVQEETCADWHGHTTKWIDGLIAAKQKGWSSGDHLRLEYEDPRRKVTVLSSKHTRTSRRGDIELRHLWIHMN